MKKVLYVPTQPRNQREERLLDEIILDSSLKNADLRRRVQDYMNHKHNYVLVAWIHPSASMVRHSFEKKELAITTYNSYCNQKPIPRIVGIRHYDLELWV